MAAHGKTLGPLGIAVYAWLEANPGSTFKEVADGLGMGESTVKRCVRQFEELGIAERYNEVTPKGLHLPTRVTVKVDPGTIERGTSDKVLHNITPSQPNPVLIEPSENTEASLSDPGTIERGTSGTPIAPLSAKNTSKDNSQPSVEAGRKRPRRTPKDKPPSAMSKLSEAERDILGVWRELAKAYPPEYAWPTIFERVLDGFDAARFKRCGGAYLAHFGKGQRHVGGILDWYERDQITPEGSGNGNVTKAQFGRPEVTRDFTKYPARTGQG